jgi:hypothetical protein
VAQPVSVVHNPRSQQAALNGLFQAAKRKARSYTRFAIMRTVLFLIAGKLNFIRINPHAA